MIVAGFDQAPRGTGWCVGDGSGPPERGYVEHGNYGDNEGALMCEIMTWLEAFLEAYRPHAIATEQILIVQATFNAHVVDNQYAVRNCFSLAAARRNIPHYQAEVVTWREHFLGLSRAPKNTPKGWLKDRALQACLDRGWLCDNDHIAESVGIWDWLLATLDRGYRARSGPARRRAEVTA